MGPAMRASSQGVGSSTALKFAVSPANRGSSANELIAVVPLNCPVFTLLKLSLVIDA